MTDAARALTILCDEYLSGRLGAEQFVSKFQLLFEDNQERLTKDEFDAFDEIYMACEYFQPEADIREMEHYLIDENELKEKVKQVKQLRAN